MSFSGVITRALRNAVLVVQLLQPPSGCVDRPDRGIAPPFSPPLLYVDESIHAPPLGGDTVGCARWYSATWQRWLPVNSAAHRACIPARPPASPFVVALVKPRKRSRNGVLQHAIARDSVHAPEMSRLGCSMMPVWFVTADVQLMQFPLVGWFVERPESGEPLYEPQPRLPLSTVPPAFCSMHEKSIHAPFAGTGIPLAASWYSA